MDESCKQKKITEGCSNSDNSRKEIMLTSKRTSNYNVIKDQSVRGDGYSYDQRITHNNNLRKVGPLPHLSSMHYEIAQGIPIVPRPVRMLQLANEEKICRKNKQSTSMPKHISTDNLQQEHKQKKQSSIDEFRVKLTSNNEYGKRSNRPLSFGSCDINVGSSMGTSIIRQNSLRSTSTSSSLLSSLSPSYDELQQIRLNLWMTKLNDTKIDASNDHQTANNSKNTDTNNGYQPEDVRSKNEEDQWIEYWDEEVGARYYYNIVTAEASWVGPAD